MEAPLEIRYAGVIIGRVQEVRGAEGETSFFLPGKDPMPVGTVVRLRSGNNETPARVVRAIESADASIAGMQVRLIGEAEEVAPDWIPVPAPVTVAKPKRGTPTPVVEVDVKGMLAESDKDAQASTAEGAAIPEVVPVTVGSSLTGALENATASTPAAQAPEESGIDVIIDTPPVVPIERVAQAPAAAPVEAVAEATLEAALRAAAEAPKEAPASASAGKANGDSQGSGDSPATAEASPTSEELPPARPIAGPSGRRKTKRRK